MPRGESGVRQFNSARALFQGSARHDVHVFTYQTSLLPYTFNGIWCEMLNSRARLGITHFGMIHDDVCPDPGWIDQMLGEMDRVDADVLSAVVPIRDKFGLTSTALEVEEGPWIVRRLTLAEVFEREPTWTEPGLLVNTGLWLAKIGPWCERVCFRFHDRIKREQNGVFSAEVIPEDWDFSRQVHSAGRKLYATRAIQLEHGGSRWHNRGVWGAWKTDETYEIMRARALVGSDGPAPAHADRWLATVGGWLSRREALALYRLAKDGPGAGAVVEVGSWQGRSTVFLAAGQRDRGGVTGQPIVAVDTFEGSDTMQAGGINSDPAAIDPVTGRVDTEPIFRRNVKACGLSSWVQARRARSVDAAAAWRDGTIRLIFIDGDHELEAVRADVDAWEPHLAPGARIAFHDFGEEGPTRVVQALLGSARYRLIERADSLVVLEQVTEPVEALEALEA
jgi:predicted O-methyltransferase YrrM